MIVQILLFPFILTVCYLVPFVSTSFSKANSQKWLLFWLVTLISSFTIIPFFVWIIGQQITLVVQIMLAIVMMVLFSNQKCHQLFGILSGAVHMANEQVTMIKTNISNVMKQYGLVE